MTYPSRKSRRILPAFTGLILILIVLVPHAAGLAEEKAVDYAGQIKPILRERCFTCHGALKQKAHLRLDSVAEMLKGGDSGPVIDRQSADDSELLARISEEDDSLRMPPQHEGDRLSADQIQLIRRWIDAGAPAPADDSPEADARDHWAFRPVTRPDVPAFDSTWIKNPVDAFLARDHAAQGLTPQPEAPRLVLLRRLFIDLLGVPPTSREVAAVEASATENWYEETVDRLLNDPRHGERWARHWMDVWRYSDWWGLGDQLRNSQKHIWHWRDWIVDSLNADTPYDEMVRLMLAADELSPDDPQNLRAGGYLARNYYMFNRTQWMDETVEHVGKGFLGLTFNCAKCHDHKFDPIEQNDYYRLRAFFEPYQVRLDLLPGETDVAKNGIPRPFDAALDAPTYRFIRGDEARPDKSTVMTPGVPSILAFEPLHIEPITLPPAAADPSRRPWVFDAYRAEARQALKTAVAAAEQLRQVAEEEPSRRVAEAAAAVARAELESVDRRATAQESRWNSPDADSTRELIAAAVRAERLATLARAAHAVALAEQALGATSADGKAAAEKTLADARTAARKAVESATAPVKPHDSFTKLAGARWSATRFRDSTADDPTPAFPETSTGRRKALAQWITDRRNPLTARVAVNQIWMRHMGEALVPTVFDFGRNGTPPANPALLDWLAAEFMESGWSMKHLHRVIVTSSAYRMSSSNAGGEANAKIDPENRFWWHRVPIRLESQVVRDTLLSLSGTLNPTIGGPPVPPGSQDDSRRRSLYFFHSNNERNLFLTSFDEALVTDCYRREQSIVPQQALALSNSRLVLESSEAIARRLSARHAEQTAFLRAAFQELLAIDPSAAELAASNAAIDSWRAQPAATDAQARANLIWALINHNDFVTLR
jgi:hypothetical protein